MEIFGIGSDIVNTKRLKKTLKKYGDRFKNKIFSKNEIIHCEGKKNPVASYAKRFAAKEALSKAMGTGFGNGFSLKEVEVLNDTFGKPSIKLSGGVLKKLKSKIKDKKYSIHLSLSDDKPLALATVIITCR